MRAVLAKRNPSVRPSVKRVNCNKTKETSAKILTPYKCSFV